VLSSNIEQIAFSYNTLVELEDTRSRRSSRSGSASDPADVENREKSSRSNSLEDLSTSSNQSRVNLTISVEKEEEEVANDLEIDHLKDVCGSLDLPSAFDEYSLHRQKKIEKSIKL
jgi:hypothetical protein